MHTMRGPTECVNSKRMAAEIQICKEFSVKRDSVTSH